MKIVHLSVAVIFAAAAGIARADQVSPVLVTAPVSVAFVPLGFDSNDDAEIVVHGHFPNTCFKVGPASASVDYATSTITVEAQAYEYQAAACGQMIIPFAEVVSLGTVKPGTYRVLVKDRPTAVTTDLVIKEATTESADDFLYAPIDVASIDTHNGNQVVRLEGSYPLTFVGCMVIKEVRVQRTPGNVIVVQPIAELLTGGSECAAQANNRSFVIERPVPAPLEAGEYLVHVRVLSGRSVNRVVDIEAH